MAGSHRHENRQTGDGKWILIITEKYYASFYASADGDKS